MTYTESSITLDFPDDNCFRFQDCTIYKPLSGFKFKEMDACWMDVENLTLYIIELKDFNEGNIEDKEIAAKKIHELFKKSVDSLQMVLANHIATDHGKKLDQDLDFYLPRVKKMVFISILNIKESQKPDLNFIRDRYKLLFKAYENLFDLKSTVISYEKAKEKFTWVN